MYGIGRSGWFCEHLVGGIWPEYRLEKARMVLSNAGMTWPFQICPIVALSDFCLNFFFIKNYVLIFSVFSYAYVRALSVRPSVRLSEAL